MDNPINLNTAQENELTLLPGIGKSMAGRIIDSRPFTEVDELLNVRGVSPAILERLKPLVYVEEEPMEVDDDLVPDDNSELADKDEESIGDILESESDQHLGEVAEAADEIIPQEKAIVPVEGEGGDGDDSTRKSKSVTWGQMLLVAAISSFSACIFAVLLSLGIIGTINGGLDFATSLQVRSIQRQVEDLDVDIDTLYYNLEGLRTRVDNFENMSGRVDELEYNFDSLSQDIDGIVDDFNGVSDEISEINETVDRFQGFLDGLADLLGNLIKQP